MLYFEFQPTAGNATWSTTFEGRNLDTGQTFQCTRDGGQALSADMGGLLIAENLGGPQLDRRFYGAGLVPALDQCPGLEFWSRVPWLHSDLRDSDLRPWQETPDGRLQGNDSETVTGEGRRPIRVKLSLCLTENGHFQADLARLTTSNGVPDPQNAK